MCIKERVLANASSWTDLAHKGEITWEKASLLINAFELGLAEFSEETDKESMHAEEQCDRSPKNQFSNLDIGE